MVRVSVILPTYNEEHDVIPAMKELDRQNYRDKELIVVDDGSSDGTYDAASGQIDRMRGARVIRTEHRGASSARNVGARAASGDILFFAESDCTYSPEYLENAVQRLDSEPQSDAVCLTGAPLKTRSTLATECIEIENKVQHRRLNEGRMRPFYAWVFRREPFLRIGGFDENLFQGEDKDLFRRFEAVGCRVAWIPGVHWWHRRDQTTWSLSRKWFARGRSRVRYTLKHRLGFDLVKSIVPFWVLIAGLLTLLVDPLVGGLLILAVAGAVLTQSVRVAVISWRDVRNHWALIGYPLFIATRNLSTGIGYQMGLVSLALGRNEPGTQNSPEGSAMGRSGVSTAQLALQILRGPK